MKKIIIHLFIIIMCLLLNACKSPTGYMPSPPPTFGALQTTGLVKTSLEFYRNNKAYEITVGYTIGTAYYVSTPRPEFSKEIWKKTSIRNAEIERYADLDNDGELEFIVSLTIDNADYYTESVQVYKYDVVHDTYFVAAQFSTMRPAIISDYDGALSSHPAIIKTKYIDIDGNGSLEFITSNYGFCYSCGAVISTDYSALTILRYENGKFIDVTNDFPALIQKDANSNLELVRKNGGKSFSEAWLSTYMYDMYRLGKFDEALPVFDQVCNDVIKPNRSNSNYIFDCVEFKDDLKKYIEGFKVGF